LFPRPTLRSFLAPHLRVATPAALGIFIAALSCSTACITATAIDAGIKRQHDAEEATKLAAQIEARLRPLLPPSLDSSSESARIHASGLVPMMTIRIIGPLRAEDRARIEEAARALYGAVIFAPTRLAIIYVDDPTAPPKPGDRVIIDPPAHPSAAPAPTPASR
jgi:hypothetical protein